MVAEERVEKICECTNVDQDEDSGQVVVERDGSFSPVAQPCDSATSVTANRRTVQTVKRIVSELNDGDCFISTRALLAYMHSRTR